MESRKKDHINLAYQAQLWEQEMGNLFNYEPMLHANKLAEIPAQQFLGKNLRLPIWVSAITGGTSEAKIINHNLAKACKEFGMGMSLGSCRAILNSNKRFEEFDIREIIGSEQPFMANLGIAQVEELLKKNKADQITNLIDRLQADGLMVHVNPLQELLQPEGDIYEQAPLKTLEKLLSQVDFPVMVKEVGQGMGPKSLAALVALPIAGIEFAALGGTNFSLIELMRSRESQMEDMQILAELGHSPAQMVEYINDLPIDLLQNKAFIISGGVTPISGLYLQEEMPVPAITGMAFSFLKHARGDYKELQNYLRTVIKVLQIAHQFLERK